VANTLIRVTSAAQADTQFGAGSMLAGMVRAALAIDTYTELQVMPVPSLLVAYQIYGDAGRADEITKRNEPRHPGFLMGGNQLEVLADG
jgi:prophage DNA circulation protein